MKIASKIYQHSRTEIEASPPVEAAASFVTLVISTGSARLQTSATAAELRGLAHELLSAAMALEIAVVSE